MAAWPHLEQELALAIGDQFDPEAVGPRDWQQLADDCLLPRRVVSNELAQMARRIRRALANEESLAVSDPERAMLATIRGVIGRRLTTVDRAR